jgi:hypothetical protein
VLGNVDGVNLPQDPRRDDQLAGVARAETGDATGDECKHRGHREHRDHREKP